MRKCLLAVRTGFRSVRKQILLILVSDDNGAPAIRHSYRIKASRGV